MGTKENRLQDFRDSIREVLDDGEEAQRLLVELCGEIESRKAQNLISPKLWTKVEEYCNQLYKRD